MNAPHITRDALLDLFPSAHDPLNKALARDDVAGFAVYRDEEGKLRATRAHGPDCDPIDRHGAQLVAIYLKPAPEPEPEPAPINTGLRTGRAREAIRYMAMHPEVTAYAAAKIFNVSTTAIYTTLARDRKRARHAGATASCPCCGQPLPPGAKPITDRR